MGVDRGRLAGDTASAGDGDRATVQAGRSAVGLSPQYRARLDRVKDHMREDLGRDVTHIEAMEYLLRYWEDWHRER